MFAGVVFFRAFYCDIPKYYTNHKSLNEFIEFFKDSLN